MQFCRSARVVAADVSPFNLGTTGAAPVDQGITSAALLYFEMLAGDIQAMATIQKIQVVGRRAVVFFRTLQSFQSAVDLGNPGFSPDPIGKIRNGNQITLEKMGRDSFFCFRCEGLQHCLGQKLP